MIKMTMVHLNRSLSMKYKRNEYITFTLFDRGLYIYIYIYCIPFSHELSVSAAAILNVGVDRKQGTFAKEIFVKS
jgi:hypothetical protein